MVVHTYEEVSQPARVRPLLVAANQPTRARTMNMSSQPGARSVTKRTYSRSKEQIHEKVYVAF
jgi:hypothetical protein